MREAKKSLIATGAVVAIVVATMGGGLVRNRIEMGPGVEIGDSITMDSLVSSTDGVPSTSEISSDPINESKFFYGLMQLLEKEYVDDITDEQALAVGAIRGMVSSLADSYSYFLKPEQMAALNDRLKGEFNGIGVELRIQYDEVELKKLQNSTIGSSGPDSDANIDPMLLVPSVVVTTVAPGSNADVAGLKAGDRIMKVNGKWSVSSEELAEIRELRAKFDSKEITEQEFRAVADEFRNRFESSITAARIADQLLLGKDGTVELEWRGKDGKHGGAIVSRGSQRVPGVQLDGNTLTLRFFQGAATELKMLKLPQDLTIDLRQSSIGDYKSMRDCLEALAPNGVYGEIRSEQARTAGKLAVSGSSTSSRNITLILDESTWGAAAVFAEALVSAGHAKYASAVPHRDLPWIEMFTLPNGSGYTLRTGTFVATEAGQ